MNTETYTRIVRVTSLKVFIDEVPAYPDPDGQKPVVRLLNRQVEGQHSAALLLALQGINAAGEIVWLCEGHTVSWLYGKPFGQAAECVYAAMRDLETIVHQCLVSRGYAVREGDYGLPEDIKPLAASFECAKWVRMGEYDWKVGSAESQENTPQAF